MAIVRLTADFVESATVEPGKRRTVYWDKSFQNFGLFVSETGHKSYVYQYRDRNTRQQSRVTFRFDLRLKKAKVAAEEARLRVQLGGKPLVEIGAKAAAGKTFKSVAVEYLEVLPGRVAKGELRPNSYDHIERQLVGKKTTKSVHWKPLHDLGIGAIDRATIATRLREIAKKHGPVAADRSRTNLSTFFAWMIGEGIRETNPVEGTNRHSDGKERERSLILEGEKPNYDELTAVWRVAPDSEYGKIVRLLILTLCRRDEIGSLKWSEIEKEARLIRLPPPRTMRAGKYNLAVAPPSKNDLQAPAREL